jgi:hypothetical protein
MEQTGQSSTDRAQADDHVAHVGPSRSAIERYTLTAAARQRQGSVTRTRHVRCRACGCAEASGDLVDTASTYRAHLPRRSPVTRHRRSLSAELVIEAGFPTWLRRRAIHSSRSKAATTACARRARCARIRTPRVPSARRWRYACPRSPDGPSVPICS